MPRPLCACSAKSPSAKPLERRFTKLVRLKHANWGVSAAGLPGRRLLAAFSLVSINVLSACSDQSHHTRSPEILALHAASTRTPGAHEWRSYLGNAASEQHSPLARINTTNVHQLERAWTYDPGNIGLIPTNPLIVNGVLYGLDGHKNLFALNAASGKELWVYPFDRGATAKGAGRGLVHWQGLNQSGEEVRYILVGQDHQLHAIDALSGQRVTDFGDGGSVDLRLGLDRKPASTHVAANTPGTLYGDLLIVGVCDQRGLQRITGLYPRLSSAQRRTALDLQDHTRGR